MELVVIFSVALVAYGIAYVIINRGDEEDEY